MAQLGYKESLYLDVTARNDWSSTLAFTERKSRGFFYPSVGLSWIIPKSFSMPSLISLGKYGLLGVRWVMIYPYSLAIR